MGKINFNKVESAIGDTFRYYSIKQLLFLADLSSSYGSTIKKKSPFDDDEIKVISLTTLAQQLRDLHKRDKDIYKKLGVSDKEMRQYIDKGKNLSKEEWDKIQEIKDKIQEIRREIKSKLKPISDKQLIKNQRKRHINKRFNVNEDWLPLH
ncbi:MAG: hypothetical protein Tsb0021_00340 [Chlamydiales bacterium]